MKYKYVVLGVENDLYKFSYSDLKKIDWAIYIPGMYSNLSKLGQFLFRFHTWKKLNNIVSLPFISVWNKYLLEHIPFHKEENVCFILQAPWVEYENQLHLSNYLRTNYKNSRIVWFISDLIATRSMREGGPLPMAELRTKYDLILSFDHNDCKRYGLTYHPLVFSSYEGDIQEMPYSDVYFLGKAKNRQKEIIKVYELLKSYGLRCDFHIVGVPLNEQVYKDEIDYDPHISYLDNLQHVLHTKCLLEIMQKDGTGFTQRGCEAVCLNKRLLTNNTNIREAPFYNSAYISDFVDVEDIDAGFIKDIPNDCTVDYRYKDNFSPIKLLKFIDNLL